MDKLTTCSRCSSNACYEQHIDDHNVTWLCMGCGFTTSTYMVEDSPAVTNYKETSPELYKDTLFTDKQGRVWIPSIITLPERGMVFLDGTDSSNWRWAGMRAVMINESEKDKYPSGQSHKMDNSSMKHFEKNSFMDALEYIGFFEVV
jgi:hypothetical protein